MSLLTAVILRNLRSLQGCSIFKNPTVKYSLKAEKTIPRITIPQKMLEKLNKKIETKKELQKLNQKTKLRFKSPLVISCRHQEYNHHKGQTYSDFRPQSLASYGWKNRKAVGDHFTLMDWDKNSSFLSESANFHDFQLDENIIQGLSEIGIKQPTEVQAKAIPQVLEGENIICAAETGSGKTLAYLLPILELINKHKISFPHTGSVRSPRCIILVPSRELATQIHVLTKHLSKFCSIRPQLVIGSSEYERKIVLDKNMDILIATPGSLRTLLSKKQINMEKLIQIVLDEADTLLDDSFWGEIKYLLNQIKGHISEYSDLMLNNVGIQVLLVSATMPRSLDEKVESVVPLDSFATITTKSLHHIMPHIKQKFLRIQPSQKPEYVLQLARKNLNRKDPVILFCKDNSTSIWLNTFFSNNNVPNLLLNGSMSHKVRAIQFKTFKEDGGILVCTDIASRGLDTVNALMVINYDFPNFVSDYIHRVGRVGRVGSSQNSHVLSLVAHKWEVDIVWRIETAARKMTSIFNVNANIKRLHTYRHQLIK